MANFAQGPLSCILYHEQYLFKLTNKTVQWSQKYQKNQYLGIGQAEIVQYRANGEVF